MDLRERLEAWRLDAGLSKRGFAKLVGVHEGLVNKWLAYDAEYRVTPKPKNLRRIAEVTEIPYDELRDLSDPYAAETAAAAPRATLNDLAPHERELVQVYRLKPETQPTVLQMVRAVNGVPPVGPGAPKTRDRHVVKGSGGQFVPDNARDRAAVPHISPRGHEYLRPLPAPEPEYQADGIAA